MPAGSFSPKISVKIKNTRIHTIDELTFDCFDRSFVYHYSVVVIYKQKRNYPFEEVLNLSSTKNYEMDKKKREIMLFLIMATFVGTLVSVSLFACLALL